MPFDLEGRITIDYSELDRLGSEIEARTSGVKAQARLELDSAQAKADAQRALKDLRAEVKLEPKVDSADVEPELRALQRAYEETLGRPLQELPRDFQQAWDRAAQAFRTGTVQQYTAALEELEQKAKEIEKTLLTSPAGAGTQAPRGRGFWNSPYSTGALLLGGVGVASGLLRSTVGAALGRERMERSVELAFGDSAQQFIEQADELSEATGYAAASLMQAQVALNRLREAAALTDDQVMTLAKLSADMAASSGLPQYMDNLTATSNVLAEALTRGGSALVDFGIRLDDDYVRTLRVNAAYAQNWETLTEAEKAQARYNAIVEQSRAIADAAAEANEGAAGSWRRLTDRLNDAKETVGKVLLPIVDSIAGLVEKIPPELIQGGIWAGLVGGMVAATAAVVNGIRQVITWLLRLAVQAHLTAGSGGGLPGTGGLPVEGFGRSAGRAVGRAGRSLGRFLGYSGGGLAEGIGYAGVGSLAQGVLGGAVLALPAAVGAGLLLKYGENMVKNAEKEYDMATRRYYLNAIRVAKATGTELPTEVAQYAAQAGWDISGLKVAGQGGFQGTQTIKIVVQDQTSGGIAVTDAQSYADSWY